MIDLTKIHMQACTAATAAVPNYTDNGTPEHTQWLACYDREFARMVCEVRQ